MFEDIIEKFMPSIEMKDYLKTVPLSDLEYDITKLIVFSPFSLTDKLEGLCKVKEYADANNDLCLSKEAESYIRSGKKALSLLAEEGVFSLEASSFDKEKMREEGYLESLYGSFDEIIDFCNKNAKPGEYNPYEPKWYPLEEWMSMKIGVYDPYNKWYTVKKWKKDSNGKYGSVCTYIVVRDKIWFYRLDANAIKDGIDYEDMYDGRSFHLPVPFKKGDLLEIDGFPFGPKSRSLILDSGDRSDFYSGWALSKNKDGLWRAGELNHSYIGPETSPMISPLYSVRRSNGYLNRDEEILETVKEFIETGRDEADAFLKKTIIGIGLSDKQISCIIEAYALKKELNLLEVNKENISTRDVHWRLPSTDLLLSKEDRKYRKGSGIEKIIAKLIKKKECLCGKNGCPESPLYLKDVIDTDSFKLSESKVTIAIGQNNQDDIVIDDLAQLQHLLAGGRCSKDVFGFINSAIVSILFKSTPNDVKMAMIDTNGAGLSIYNELPHLMTKVETDSGKALTILELINDIMCKRYTLFFEKGVRNINQYNEKMALNNKRDTGECDSCPDVLPEIVVIATELADLIESDSYMTETFICRISKSGEAAGIHLILGTHNPSVEVVTGLVKANILNRIAFKTDNSIESRILLDKAGAEKLQVEGEMLYRPNGQEDVIKIQAARISQKEIDNVVGFWKTMRK